MSISENEQLVLIAGDSAAGKSASLRHLPNQPRWVYANAEGKRLPFRHKFQEVKIEDPYEVESLFEEVGGSPDYDGVIIDSVTFLMDMMESMYVLPSADTQKAWGEYGQFFKRLMQSHVNRSDKAVIILGHNVSEFNEKESRYDTRLAIKGAVGKGKGAEAYFSTVVYAKAMELKKLEPYESDILVITDEERELGYKHVFQTRITKDTVGARVRSPMGMFPKEQSFMDNDASLLLQHLHEFYNG